MFVSYIAEWNHFTMHFVCHGVGDGESVWIYVKLTYSK